MAETEHRGYPLPEPENDVADDVYLLRQALQQVDGDVHALLQAISGLAPTAHSHEISSITGLTAALAGKAADNHTHGLDDLTDVQSAGATPGSIIYMGPSGQWIVGSPASVLGTHQHTIANVEGLQDALDGKLVSSALPEVLAGYTTKATPVDADTFLGFDSAAGNAPKRFSWLGIKNTLKALFDTLYSAVGHTHDDRYFTETEADNRYVNASGDTMSGPLTIRRSNANVRNDGLVVSPSDFGTGKPGMFVGHVGDNTGYFFTTYDGVNSGNGYFNFEALTKFAGETHLNAITRVYGDGNRLRFGGGSYAVHFDGGSQIGFLGADGGWRLRVNNSGQLLISGNLLQFAGTAYSVHFDGSQIGFLGASGQWLARVNNSGDMTLTGGKLNLEGTSYGIRRVGSEVYITGSDGGVRFAVREGGTLWTSAWGELDDKFVSPNDAPTFSGMTVQGSGPTINFADTDNDDWLIHVNSNIMYFKPSSAGFDQIRFHPDGNIRLQRLADYGRSEYIADAVNNAHNTATNAQNTANAKANYDAFNGLGEIAISTSNAGGAGTNIAGSSIGFGAGTWKQLRNVSGTHYVYQRIG